MIGVLQPGHRVHAHSCVVVHAFEVLMHFDHPIDLVGDPWADHLGSDRRMVGVGDDLAHVVAQRPDDHVDVCSRSFGHRRRLQTVHQLGNLEALDQLVGGAQQRHDPIRNVGEIFVEVGLDVRHVVGAELRHTDPDGSVE